MCTHNRAFFAAPRPTKHLVVGIALVLPILASASTAALAQVKSVPRPSTRVLVGPYAPPAAPANAASGESERSKSESSPYSKPSVPLDPRAVEVKLKDGGVLKMSLVDDVIEIAGRYGTLRIAPVDIRRIEFAERLPAATQKQIDKALTDLDSRDETVRAAAATQLVALGRHAYPVVLKLAENKDSIPGKEAAKILEKIQDAVEEKDLSPRATDVIHTGDSTITGTIVPPALRVNTSQFGELSLKVTDIRSLRSQSLPDEEEEREPEPTSALPDPGQLSNFHGQMGQTLRFRVTGVADGALWGTGIYTTDSQLSAAAVHSGALKAGQTGIVSVKIVQGLPQYAGTVSNGVNSFGYGAYPVAFEILKKKK